MKPEQIFNKIYADYDKYLVIPVIMFLAALSVLGYSYFQNGEFLEKGIDFKGGTEITYSVKGDFNTQKIENELSGKYRADINALTVKGGNNTFLVLQIPPPEIEDPEEAQRIISKSGPLGSQGLNAEVEGFNPISPAVSGQFFKQAQLAFILAFTIMSLAIFAAFRDLVPSIAVILAATGDIVFAAAGMYILGIPLTLGSLAALLMLIGYSVDTDIVLSTRVLKRQRKPMKERIWTSVKTGLTMSSGGIAGFTLLYFVSIYYVGPSELSAIASVMVIGLLADIPFTWFGNSIILKKYVEENWSYDVDQVIPWK